MKKMTVCFLLLVLGLAPGPAQAADPFAHVGGQEAMLQAVQAYIQDHQDETVGGTVAVFTADDLLLEESFGWANRATDKPMTPESAVEWGSITKTLVWVSLMQLEEQGLVDFNADVATYLPADFVAQIDYDQPVTILDLMNHQAGYEETYLDLFLSQPRDNPSLEEALLAHPPDQVFAPGTVTAYSNWGAALGGYLVECVTGESFAAYVHQHVFKPLGMDRTALLPDLSDQEAVQADRYASMTYLTKDQAFPGDPLGIPMYPAGMATGSAEDLRAFGQALLSREEAHPLFEDPATADRLFTATDTFPSGLTRNAHGFWNTVYAVDAIGHGGNTAASSSHLLLNPERGFGVVVMTNESGEQVFNWELMPLIFGPYTDHPSYDPDKSPPRHFYTSYRAVFSGPLSFSQLGYLLLTQEDLEDHWEIRESPGSETLVQTYGDMRQASYGEVAARVLPLIVLLLGVLYSLGHLLGSVGVSLVRRIRKRRKHVAAKAWYWGGLVTLVLFFLGVIALFATAMAFQPGDLAVGFSVLSLVLMVLMGFSFLGHLVALFRKEPPARKSLVLLQALFLATAIGFGLYWEVYQFWVL